MRLFRNGDQHGASNIELVILVLIIGVLLGLIFATHNGIDEKQDNNERQRDVDELQVEMESYFSKFNQYPTLADVNNSSWRQANMKGVNEDVLRDPNGTSTQFSAEPAKNTYAYHVTSTKGKACDNVHSTCTEYTLTATLAGGGQYVKKNID